MKRQGVFISYSKKDSKWLEYLRPHLSYLEQDFNFSIWEDSKIAIGSDWQDEIRIAIGTAKVAILMISANFLSSNFIKEEELPALLRAAENDGAIIFPIIISPCMFSDIKSISKFQTVNSPSNPLINMKKGEREGLFHKVTKEVKRVLSSEFKKSLKSKSKIKSPLSDLKLSFCKVVVLNTFYKTNSKNGLSITDVVKLSKAERRKDIVMIIQELDKLNAIKKIKLEKNVYFKLTDTGKGLIELYKERLS